MTLKTPVVIIVFILLFSLSCTTNKKVIVRPDIILINIDDMGWKDVGFMGSEYYETPEIDRLASKGIIFSQAYASASNCAPSRASMMTGQWTPRHGIYTVNNSDRGKSENRKLIPVRNKTTLPDSFRTISETLQNAGYFTIHAGKWHLSEDPLTQGFNINIGGCEAGNPGSYYPPYKRVPIESPDKNKYLTDLIMDMVIENIDSLKDDNPLFLYYSPYAVHTPIHPVKTLLPKYRDKPEWNGQHSAGYATMVENLDSQIGRLIDALERTDRLNNCFIIFIL